MIRQQQLIVAVLTATFGILCSGCGGGETGPQRFPIGGQVTYNGEPIVDGEISFRPVGEDATAPTTSAIIKNGQYDVEVKYGIAAGTYSIHVNSYKPLEGAGKNLPGSDLDRPPGIVLREQLLPEKFNTKSTIENLVVDGTAESIEQNYELND